MHIIVLGSAAGGGLPQWNCACDNCRAARSKPLTQRSQASIAVSAGGQRWLLVNATTDFRRQIAGHDALAAQPPRRSPISAVALTDANVDAAFGLVELRHAERLSVYSTQTVRDVLLSACSPLNQFTQPPHVWHVVGESPMHVSDAVGVPLGLRLRALDAGGVTPLYDGARTAGGAVGALLINDGTHRLLYAPSIPMMTDELRRELALADAVFLDGTFWSDHEFSLQGLGPRTARQMGHVPISGDGGSLRHVVGVGGRHRYFTHINNTNPVLDASSDAARQVREAGWSVADDGLSIDLAK